MFTVNVTDAPILDPIEDVSSCDYYILEPISGTNLSGNEAYWTASGDSLNAGDTVNETMALEVIASVGECADTTEFNITIIPSSELDSIADVFVCDYYILEEITGTNLTGNEKYFDGTDSLDAGDTIFVTTTITVTANNICLLYTSPSPRDGLLSRMPSSA